MRETLKKRWWIIAIVVVLIAALAGFLIYNNSKKNDKPELTSANEMPADYDPLNDQDNTNYDNGIEFEEEGEGADLQFKKADESDFYGTWEATSGNAMYLYGNVEITIKKGGKWTGNIAEEDLEGEWTYDGTTMSLTSELYNATLSFTQDGKLVMQEDRDEDGNLINTVMTKK